MKISIELLTIKLQVLVGMLGIVGLIGLAILLAAVVWMVIRVANFDSLIPPLIGVVLSLVVIAGGLAWTPASGEAARLTASAWLSDVLDVDLGMFRKFAEENVEDFENSLNQFADREALDRFIEESEEASEDGEPSESGDEQT